MTRNAGVAPPGTTRPPATRRALPLVRALGCAALAAAMTVAAPAGADGAASDTRAAEALFQDGRKLMAADAYAEACAKFAESQRLAPAIGTLLNLADCYEKNGQIASAWGRFSEAAMLARRLGRTGNEKTARTRADKLEPHVTKLTIAAPAGADVELDGVALARGSIGAPLPIDPGEHTVVATAAGKRPFSTTIEVAHGAKTAAVEIPELEDAPDAAAPPPSAPETEPPPTSERGGGSGQKTLGLITAGVGVVGLGVSAFFGLRASSKWDEAKGRCDGLACDRQGVTLATQAKNSGNVSTAAAIAGGALVVGGAVLFFTAGSRTAVTAGGDVRVGLGLGSIELAGSFR